MSSIPSKKVAIIVTFAVILAVPFIVLASRDRTPADPAIQLAFKSMSSDLRGLAMTQSIARVQRGRFLTDPEQLGHLSSPGVTPPVITLADTGWAATVGFRTIPGIRCAIGVYTRNPIKRFAKSGEVVCE